jgi:hypothetical protein
MARRTAGWAALGFLAILSGDAHAQGLVVQRNLSLAMARTIAEATIAECKSKGFNTSAAVVDGADGRDVAPQGIHSTDVSDLDPRVSEADRRRSDAHAAT